MFFPPAIVIQRLDNERMKGFVSNEIVVSGALVREWNTKSADQTNWSRESNYDSSFTLRQNRENRRTRYTREMCACILFALLFLSKSREYLHHFMIILWSQQASVRAWFVDFASVTRCTVTNGNSSVTKCGCRSIWSTEVNFALITYRHRGWKNAISAWKWYAAWSWWR